MPKKYPQYIIDKAIQLRVEKKYTVPEIADILSIPKSTVHNWLLEYKLEDRTEKQTEAQKRGTAAMKKKFADMRDEAYQEAWEQAPKLLKDYSLFAFVCMYIGEGSRKNRNEVALANSNVKVMQLAYKWIVNLKHPERSLEFYAQIHVDHDEEEIKTYWGEQIGIDPQLVKIIRKSNSGKLSGRKFRSPYGVFTIRASDTYFRSRMQAFMDYVQEIW
jgi:hypothetical protein